MNTVSTTLVFVFGTLKRGYSNGEHYLGKAEFLGEAISTEGNYMMQDVGFPTLWQNNKRGNSLKGRVAGELYLATPEQLAACDRLESNGRMYTRVERLFKVKPSGDPNPFFVLDPPIDGANQLTEVTAWVYLWNLDRTNPPVEPVNGVLVWDREGQRKIRRAG